MELATRRNLLTKKNNATVSWWACLQLASPKKAMDRRKKRKRNRRKRLPKMWMVMNWRDLFRPICSTTITEGQSSVKNTQVCPLKSNCILDLTCIVLELSLPDLSKLIGDEWKKLSENQRAVSLNQNYYFSFSEYQIPCNFAISFNT